MLVQVDKSVLYDFHSQETNYLVLLIVLLSPKIPERQILTGESRMLPYVAQGAAQAMEDAAVLTCVLSLIDDLQDIDLAIEIYEGVRKHRGEAIQLSAAQTKHALHLPDGPAQVKRDEAMAGTGRNPDLWADREWQDFVS